MIAGTAAAAMYLLRHGEVEGGARYRGSTDDRLTAHGLEQMWTAVAAIAPPDCVVSSPLVRCADFARDFGRRHSLPVRVDPRWREIDFGAWEGRTSAEIAGTSSAELIRFYRDPCRHGPPGGELLESMRARVLAAWRDVCRTSRATLVVTHGGPIRVILAETRGVALNRLLQIDVAHGALCRVALPSAIAPATPVCPQ